MANLGEIGLGIINSVNRVVALVVRQLRAALGNNVDTGSQVDDANRIRLVNRDGLHLQGLGSSGQAIDLGLFVERVVHLHCRVELVAASQLRHGTQPRERG